ncbi:glycosyltransferase family 2 protein [Roseococcus sp. DSY-14]|uniref:glycosyltransferase family 2 protein n=1 Tax=Roseococcus sp. DSY-14 TaxID=3369650 RepID=UPI00387A8938
MAAISVVCPVHDTPPPLLEAAARAVLAEPVAELLLADDASRREETRAALAALAAADPRVRVLRTEANLGPAGARNLAWRAARGEWVGFTDADDQWLPGRAALLADALAREPAARWLSGPYRITFPDGRAEDLPPLSGEAALGAAPLGGGWHRLAGPALTRRLPRSFCVHLGPTLVRRDALEELGGFREGVWIGEDTLLFLLLSARHPLLYRAGPPLYAQRMEGASITNSAVMLRRGDAGMLRRAMREPLLRPFRRELRWALYSAEKQLAASNLLASNYPAAFAAALRGWALDPRELPALLRFARAALAGGEARRALLGPYSAARVIVPR